MRWSIIPLKDTWNLIIISNITNLRNKTLCYFQWYILLTNNFGDIIVFCCIGMKGKSQPLRAHMTTKSNKCIISGSLPQWTSRPTTNFLSTGRAKQVPPNQCGPQQHQCPLGRAPLATEDKDVDHIPLVSQWESSELLLPQGSTSGMHTAKASLLAATHPADSKSGWLDPLGSPPPALTALCLACSHLAAKQGGPPSLAQVNSLWQQLCQHSSGVPCLRDEKGPTVPHRLLYALLVCSPMCSSSNSNKYPL